MAVGADAATRAGFREGTGVPVSDRAGLFDAGMEKVAFAWLGELAVCDAELWESVGAGGSAEVGAVEGAAEGEFIVAHGWTRLEPCPTLYGQGWSHVLLALEFEQIVVG